MLKLAPFGTQYGIPQIGEPHLSNYLNFQEPSPSLEVQAICGRFTSTTNNESLPRLFSPYEPIPVPSRYNIAPTSAAPACVEIFKS